LVSSNNIAIVITQLVKDSNPNLSTFAPDEKVDQKAVDKTEKLAIAEADIKTKLTDIIGNSEAIGELQKTIDLPITQPDFSKGLPQSKGLLLYGTPGTGKTLLAKAAAYQLFDRKRKDPTNKKITEPRFVNVSASDLLGSFQGETEKAIANLFKVTRNYKGKAKDKWAFTEDADDIESMFTIIFFLMKLTVSLKQEILAQANTVKEL
jgi:SpoVK/Ycf46/Vps4 family AAA+-type ATPase